MRDSRGFFNSGYLRSLCGATALAVAGATAAPDAAALEEGDILVSDINQDIVIAIDPISGEQTVIVPNGVITSPGDIEVEPDGGVLISDAFDDQIYRLDPVTGDLTPLLTNGSGVTGLGVSVFGEIFVPNNTAQTDGDEIRQVDPVTGDLTVITSGGFLTSPVDISVEANGDLLVLDSVTTSGTIIRVERATGSQIVVATDGGARAGNGIDIEASGTVVIANSFEDAVVRINPDTGDQTILTAEGALVAPRDVAVDVDGSIVVTDEFLNGVFRVDAVTGDVTPIATDGFLVSPTGVAIFRTGIPVYECAGFAPPAADGPVTVTMDGTLLLRATLLNAGGQPVTGPDLTSVPAIQVTYAAQPPADAPTDVTGNLLGSLPFFQGNEFIFPGALGQWAHGQQTGELSAPGVYTLSMVSGDRSEYRVKPTCEVTFVRE